MKHLLMGSLGSSGVFGAELKMSFRKQVILCVGKMGGRIQVLKSSSFVFVLNWRQKGLILYHCGVRKPAQCHTVVEYRNLLKSL